MPQSPSHRGGVSRKVRRLDVPRWDFRVEGLGCIGFIGFRVEGFRVYRVFVTL